MQQPTTASFCCDSKHILFDSTQYKILERFSGFAVLGFRGVWVVRLMGIMGFMVRGLCFCPEPCVVLMIVHLLFPQTQETFLVQLKSAIYNMHAYDLTLPVASLPCSFCCAHLSPFTRESFSNPSNHRCKSSPRGHRILSLLCCFKFFSFFNYF